MLLLGSLAAACFVAGAEVDAWTLSGRSLLPIDANDAVVRVLDPHTVMSPRERKAAALFIDYLDNHASTSLNEADRLYSQMSDNRIGSDWAALKWMCHYLLLPPGERPRYLASNPDGARLVAWFEPTGFSQLRDPLIIQYRLDTPLRLPRDAELATTVIECLMFMNPARPDGEKTDAILKCLDIRRGDRVADIGCGPGSNSFRLAGMVGPQGRVYAIETNPRHLSFVAFVKEREHLSNIELVKASPQDIGLPAASLDRAFICWLYNGIYASVDASSREFFLASIWRALKPGGRLIVADNCPTARGTAPFVNLPARIVAANLQRYGFEYLTTTQPAPQRYVLVLRKPL